MITVGEDTVEGKKGGRYRKIIMEDCTWQSFGWMMKDHQ